MNDVTHFSFFLLVRIDTKRHTKEEKKKGAAECNSEEEAQEAQEERED
jgi:hypothetical protein